MLDKIYANVLGRWYFWGGKVEWASRGLLQVVMADCMGVAMRIKIAQAARAALSAGGAAGPAAAAGSNAGEIAGEAGVADGPTHHVVQAATDMWAVGACAWELLTGRPLFGDNFSDVWPPNLRVSSCLLPPATCCMRHHCSTELSMMVCAVVS